MLALQASCRAAAQGTPFDGDAAPTGDPFDFGVDVRERGVAHRIAAGADVDAQFAPPGDHVDGTAGHFELAHRAHETGFAAAPTLHGEHDFGCGRSGIM